MGGSRRLRLWIVRGAAGAVAAALLSVVVALAVLQTAWAKDRIRRFVVSQANRYLSGTLEIDRLEGSLFRGIELSGVRLARDATILVSIDHVAVDYSLRELFGVGTTIRRLEIHGLRVSAAREQDGRWNLATLIRRDPDRPAAPPPGRPISIQHVFLRDGSVAIAEPISVGPVHVPTRYEALSASLAFSYQPRAWAIVVHTLSVDGREPRLPIRSLSGTIRAGSTGWNVSGLRVATARSDFTVHAGMDRGQSPARLDVRVVASRFAFQEWAGILQGLRNIAVEAGFEARLSGPTAALDTSVTLQSGSGDVQSRLVLDTTVPGWRASGAATLRALDLADWLTRPEQRSTITGTARFELDLDLGGHFPRGRFSFNGPRVVYAGYEATAVSTRGVLTATEARIAAASARAYGADVTLGPSTLAIDRPFGFTFAGRAAAVDLRRMPRTLPVPHVESTLDVDFDVSGQFASPFLRGSGIFRDSVFLGAHVAAGATGFIDTGATPFHYQGEARIENVDLHRFGEALEIGWLREPRYAGVVAGTFHVDGTGSDVASLSLEGGGRLAHARIFGGELSNADVSIAIADRSLQGAYDGEFSRIDPATALADQRYAASLTGVGRGRVAVRDLLVRSPDIDDYDLDAQLTLVDSSLRGFDEIDGHVDGRLTDGTLSLAQLSASSPHLAVDASGVLALHSEAGSHIEFNLPRGDLEVLRPWTGQRLQGGFSTTGVVTGPLDTLTVTGDLTLTAVEGAGVSAGDGTLKYGATVPSNDPARTTGTLEGTFSSVKAGGRNLGDVATSLRYDKGHIVAGLAVATGQDLRVQLDLSGALETGQRALQLESLTLEAGPAAWRLAASARPRLSWTDAEVLVDDLRLTDASSGTSQLSIAGTWRTEGGGRLLVHAGDISVDALTARPGVPARWGGLANLTAEISGSRARPLVDARFEVTGGRVRRLSYDRFAGEVRYADDVATLSVRLDQAPGVWLTAAGRVPRRALVRDQHASEQAHSPNAMRVELQSSAISLGLIEGVTDIVRNVSGTMRVNVTVLGAVGDPHFEGQVEIGDGAFEVAASGARYEHGRLALQLTPERVEVEALHLEDRQGDPLDITGSLAATHELKVEGLEVAITTRAFQVLRNEYGEVDVDADLTFRGEFLSPRLDGRIALAGGAIAVDRILDSTLTHPYATREAPLPEFDPLSVLNPWERMGMDVSLKVPGNLRMIGENVQVAGAPLGLGDFNLRAIGDLYLYKDPGQPLFVTGSFDSVSGTYVFQGRRFELDPNSSINFRGDLVPELYVMVKREISGVETRVTISGTIQEPELILASTPPLEPSDILSLIVFNTSTNDLSALQQQQLAVRAGTIAAGFLAAPMLGALERSLGIDTLEIEPGADVRGGPRVTVGNEIAPGLVARFSRQFGPGEYSEAVIEYYLSRVLSLRARFSDAGTLAARSPFRRVERAGIDLLVFFSF